MAQPDATRGAAIAGVAEALAREEFKPAGDLQFPSDPVWAALKATGTLLWLDTGDLDAARKLWTSDFSNLTTNNTLVNKEVQKGLFDELIPHAAAKLREAQPDISQDDLVIEVGFVINCRTALRLVEAFDATVSVELHPAMADDADLSYEYGRRYYAVCPERFIVKVPLTPAGFLAARRLSADGIPINYTLGFSARQNVLAAAVSRPTYVNVFMGRLNSFVADNHLGDGINVGEKTTMSTQVALREGREQRGWETLLIGASLRSGQQILDLAGLDVFTMPPAAAEEFHALVQEKGAEVTSQVGRDFAVDAQVPEVLDRLWTVPDAFYQAAEALANTDTTGWTGRELAGFIADQGVSDLFHEWSTEQLARIQADGKVPTWEYWQEELTSGRVALDDLMTVSALYSFVKDQEALDTRIRKHLPA
jgi:transaldolase